MDEKQKQDEVDFRQVERALLYADDAARKISKIAEDLSKGGADPHLVAVLRDGCEEIREQHRAMMKRVYFRAPESGAQQELSAAEPTERLAS